MLKNGQTYFIPQILKKFLGHLNYVMGAARFLNYVRSIFNIMHGQVKLNFKHKLKSKENCIHIKRINTYTWDNSRMDQVKLVEGSP